MKKTITLFWLLFSFLSYAQSTNCTQDFYVTGEDADAVSLTVNSSDLTCAFGPINSIKISDAFLDSYFSWFSDCGDYYEFLLDLDGVVTTVCADDLIDMTITEFQTLTITAVDLDNDSDEVEIYLEFQVNFDLLSEPNCTTVTGPLSNENSSLSGILTWNAAQGAQGYKISVGTTSGGTDILNMHTVGVVTTYDIPGNLLAETEYFVTVTPFNSIGDAASCVEYSFITPEISQGNACDNAIPIVQLPFTVSGDTADNLDIIYEGSPGATGCGSTSSYLNGNDVVYAFTAENSGSISLTVTPTNNYAGVFIYDSCSNIGVNCMAGDTNNWSTDILSIENFVVEEGTTYFIVISTYAAPQTTSYVLNITENTCTNPVVTYNVVTDCEENYGEFTVDVIIEDLGSAESITISDNQESTAQVVSQAGTYTFGPFANTVNVVITTQNNQDESCEVISGTLTALACPPNCDNAVVIAGCNIVQTANFAAGTGSWSVENDCGYTANGVEKLYSFTPEATGEYKLTITSATGGYVDYLYKEASSTCDETGWICIDDLNFASTVTIGTLTAGVQYLFLLDSEGTSIRSHQFKIDCLPTCTNPTVTYQTTIDCDTNEGEFSIEVTVSDMGTAESLTMSDDQESTSQTVSQTGTFTFGPYAMGTEVIITTSNDQDETCVLTSNEITILQCPPANDECDNAVTLEVGGTFAENMIITSNNGATKSTTNHDPESISSGCDSYDFNVEGKDVWFTVVVPDSGSITIETDESDDELFFDDTALFVYTGTCENMTYVDCSGDEGNGAFSKVELTDLSPGSTLLVRVFGYGGDSGEFQISAYDESLSNDNFAKEKVSVYPNPVKDILNISHFKNITNVEVYNLLGQRMIQQNFSEINGSINMEALASGGYIVKIYAEGEVQSVKVIKQ